MRKNWREPTSHQESSGFLVSSWNNYGPRCRAFWAREWVKKIILYPESSGSLVSGWSPREILVYWKFCRESRVKKASEKAEPFKGRQSKIFHLRRFLQTKSLYATNRWPKSHRTLGTGLKRKVKSPIHKNFKHFVAIEY